MVYYAYAKNSNDDWSWRYVIIAPTFHILNDWYNAVRGRVGEDVLWRVSDDFYVFNRQRLNLGRSTTTGAEAPQFMNKLIFQLLSDNEGRNITTFVNELANTRTAA
ncbi:hypothetical protein DL766_007718 [Monosporascus sp. MC13-8B]|uniref:Uncharacterized protein n=1 Tax=Monosporascus cannonballus TaxID=155416 RepID=A0ABY0H493_9PEZI|nr:hypothetical protein DL762_007257 [Monosporascus cannonballus]RYO84827.1 hypothetical protein DL763_007337 [Monosporascus cannonballus]RYP22481.1 hypothetical protein DL766_007718 [Monosporascus sp. MC13-8B]